MYIVKQIGVNHETISASIVMGLNDQATKDQVLAKILNMPDDKRAIFALSACTDPNWYGREDTTIIVLPPEINVNLRLLWVSMRTGRILKGLDDESRATLVAIAESFDVAVDHGIYRDANGQFASADGKIAELVDGCKVLTPDQRSKVKEAIRKIIADNVRVMTTIVALCVNNARNKRAKSELSTSADAVKYPTGTISYESASANAVYPCVTVTTKARPKVTYFSASAVVDEFL